MQYAVWYRDEEGLHTAAELVSLVFERSSDVAGFPSLKTEQEDVDPLMASCRAMQTILSVSPKFFAEDAKLATLAGKYSIGFSGTKTFVDTADKTFLE